jgi:excisionase family DNA binding protein
VQGGSNRLIGLREAAEMLGVSYSTLQGSWKDLGLPAKRLGGSVKIRERDLINFIDKLPDAA